MTTRAPIANRAGVKLVEMVVAAQVPQNRTLPAPIVAESQAAHPMMVLDPDKHPENDRAVAFEIVFDEAVVQSLPAVDRRA